MHQWGFDSKTTSSQWKANWFWTSWTDWLPVLLHSIIRYLQNEELEHRRSKIGFTSLPPRVPGLLCASSAGCQSCQAPCWHWADTGIITSFPTFLACHVCLISQLGCIRAWTRFVFRSWSRRWDDFYGISGSNKGIVRSDPAVGFIH